MKQITDMQFSLMTKQFFFVMKKYILPLLPVHVTAAVLRTSLVRLRDEAQFNRMIDYDKDSGILTVVPQKKNPAFKLVLNLPAGKSYAFRATEAILNEISAVLLPMSFESEIEKYSETAFSSVIDKIFIDDLFYIEAIADTAFERGLSVWLGGTDTCGVTIFRLLNKLNKWTRKTYEGRHISFGIIIDKDSEAGSLDYIEFLESKNSALVSDGVFSAICLDRNGKLLKSVPTLYSNEISPEEKSDMLVPYEYVGFAGMCRNNKIGVISLSSGDTLVIKDSKLIFSKRNDEWGIYDYDNVINGLSEFLARKNPGADHTKMWEYRVLAREIYKTMLDVSFSHTGGCLGILEDRKEVDRLIDNSSITYDSFLNGKYNNICDKNGIDRSAQRRQTIAGLIWYDGKPRNFSATDRKLRMELMSFDGAVIIDTDGEYLTVGSIVKVEGGGEGGRKLAAQSLSSAGMGIRISSDGRITSYEGIDRQSVFVIN